MMPQRISKKIFTYLFIFFSLVTITNTKISNNFYKINEFEINGLNLKQKNKLYNDLNIFKNDNIFLLDKENISEKIKSYLWVSYLLELNIIKSVKIKYFIILI